MPSIQSKAETRCLRWNVSPVIPMVKSGGARTSVGAMFATAG